ncbi:Transcriptional repressor p66-beta [Fasciola hepatica]|uniref:Transcriptional repressor p66-beta n=1 Tax=Fasciola hepatica TaxID=6192 RepID=A0A4E0RPZ8_FASHE|nr:Transcriptional repressor p66-beta [Fasciola hepatica]
MPQCCFAGCHNRTDDGRGLSFFRFPRRDVTRTECWVRACGRHAFVPSQHSRVCSQHFKPDDFERDIRSELLGTGHKRLRLKDTAIPMHSSETKHQTPVKNDSKIASKETTPSLTDDSLKADEAIVSTEPTVEKRKLDCAPRNACGPPMKSEDEDEAMIDALCNEMEKENAPNSVLHSKTKALLAKMESELRNEESTLLLLQQLRANQRAHSTQLRSSKTTTPHSTPKAPVSAHSNSMYYHITASDRIANSPSPARMPSQSVVPTRPVQAPSQGLQQQPNVTSHQVPRVTKVMALQALEQQWNGKKAVLHKHLEKSLDKVPLPRPSSGAGPSDVAFVPSTLTNEFTALIGLEEIVHTIQDYDPSCSGKADEQHRPCTPFVCANCGTDFTPVWKRKRSGSSDVVCEACIIDGLRSGIHRSYSNMVSAALKQNATSERELEHEYQEIVNSPTKLEAFIKEQERKLLAAQPPPIVPTQPQPPQPSSSVNPIQNQRYHQQSFQAQNAYTNVGARHPQAAAINNAASAATAAAAHLSIPVANARRQAVSSNTLVTSASAPSLSIAQHQNQVAATSNVVQQFATQYQQLTKAAAAAAQTGHVTGGSNVTANLMMAAAAANPMLVAAAASATNQQQQQQQAAAAAAAVQQRLVAAAALSGFQHQQQQQQQQTTLDQYARLQELLVNTILCNAATAGTQSSAVRQPQHAVQQALLQYACLLQQQQQQQQQQQAATQAQQQQQANAAALQQFMSNSVSNSAACMALLQSWYALNAAAGAGAKK